MAKGWFESEEDYSARVREEAAERIIEESTGSAPHKGWFESDEDYRSRVTQEANERVVADSTGSEPRKGFFESDSDYRTRVFEEANARVIEEATGSSPRKGMFESDDEYRSRIFQEANEATIRQHAGSSPRQGIFESNGDYKQRVGLEARELRVEVGTSGGGASSDGSGTSDHSDEPFNGGLVIIAGIAIVFLGVVFAAGPKQKSTDDQPQAQLSPTTAANSTSLSNISPNNQILNAIQLVQPDWGIVNNAIANGGQADATDGTTTPLIMAVNNRNMAEVQYLLAHGATIDKPDNFGRTPMFHGVARGFFDIAKYLIGAGANVNVVVTLPTDGDTNEPPQTLLDYVRSHKTCWDWDIKCKEGWDDFEQFIIQRGAATYANLPTTTYVPPSTESPTDQQSKTDQPAPSTATDPPNHPIISNGVERLAPTYVFDFENGLEPPSGGLNPNPLTAGDIWFGSTDDGQGDFEEYNNSAIALVNSTGVASFDTCAKANFSFDPVPVIQLQEGTHLCIKTRHGHMSYLEIQKIEGSSASPQAVTFSYLTWQ